MKKLLVVLAFGLLMAGKSEAAGPTRGAKTVAALNYTVTVTTISLSSPAVLYSIIMSTGATNDFVTIFDSATAAGIASNTTNSSYRTRCTASSTLTFTQCNFDPPLQFNNGMIAVLSAVANQALIVYEKGRVTNGY